MIRAEAIRRTKRAAQIIAERKLDPLPELMQTIIANDLAGAEFWDARLRAGVVPYDDAVRLCGSYARMEYALKWQLDGFASREHLMDILPDEWPDADPDDTDPDMMDLWVEAWERNGQQPVGAQLPPGDTLKLWRGQSAGSPVGCSWSLDRKVALRFALAAWAAMSVPHGELLTAEVPRDAALAYLTSRHEAEVILDFRLIERA